MISRISSPKTVFIARSGLLGDTVVAIPSIVAIRRAFPKARLVYVGELVPGAKFVRAEEILGGTGLVDEFLYYHTGGNRLSGLISLLRLAVQTLLRRPDLVVVLEAPSRFTRKPRFFRALGCLAVPSSDSFSPDRVPPRPTTELVPAISEQLLGLIHKIGIPVGDIASVSSRLPLRPTAAAPVADWLSKLENAHGKRLLGLSIWSNMSAKRWPLERYRQVVDRLLAAYPDLFPIILGGAAEYRYGEELTRCWGTGSVAAGKFSIHESAQLLTHCALYMGNDTGTMHLAAAVGVPCVAIFSARDQPGKWNPVGTANVVLRKDVPCSGCLLRECYDHQLRCLIEISVDDVFTACALQLGPIH